MGSLIDRGQLESPPRDDLSPWTDDGPVYETAEALLAPWPSSRQNEAGEALMPSTKHVDTPVEPSYLRRIGLAIKRGIDLTAASIVLVALSPIMAVIAVAIKLDSRGPVFHNRPRVGLGGRIFIMYKFRTMVPDAEERLAELQHLNRGGAYMIKIENDPRVTRLGRMLRQSSMDELPQLLNVVRGEMSLIGPRPQAPNEVALYTAQQRLRLTMRPGISGLWQVRSRHDWSFQQMMRWDTIYITRWSLWFDLSIAVETLVMIMRDIQGTMLRNSGRGQR